MRRTFRRHIRKTLSQAVPPVLQEAVFAFDKGEYGRAGELFERLAEAAAARGTARAPVFYIQAGTARLRAGQKALGMPSLRRGLELLAERQQFRRLRMAGARVLSELGELGLQAEAAEIGDWLETAQPAAAPNDPPAGPGELPARCGACGAAVRPDEVEWLDESTVECAYCGSRVQ